jgi:short-subunit dehydrogenase
MASKAKSCVLITGASSGIGFELAKIFATENHDLIITSGNRAKLETAAHKIRACAPATRIDVIAADLARPDGAEQLHRAVQKLDRPVDILINNAGVGVWGEFVNTDLAAELAMIQLNATAVVQLTKLFLQDMLKRNAGKILITASEASLTALPLATIYGATKAFLYSFAQGLREELKDTGITVTALLPGPTRTDFFHRAGAAHTKTAQGNLADPAQVARAGYDALMSGDDHVVTPFKDKMIATLTSIIPDRTVAHISRFE